MNLPVPAPATSVPAGPALRDIHVPPPPSWWPPAPGWWVLALLIFMLATWAGWRWIARRRHLRARTALMAMVDSALADAGGRSDEGAAALHALLRRAARRLDPRADTLQGDAWRAMLERVPVDATVIDRLVELDALVYRPAPTMDRESLGHAVRQWLGALADQTRRGRTGRRALP